MDDEAGGHAVFPFVRGEAEGTHTAGWLIIPSCKDAPSVETALPYRRRNPTCVQKDVPAHAAGAQHTPTTYPYPYP